MNRMGILLKILLASLIMLTSVLAKSQEYHPMIGENKQWVIKESSKFTYIPGPNEIRYFFHFFEGDTIINGIKVAKLFRQQFYFTDQMDSINNVLNDKIFDNYLEEDSINQRIEIYPFSFDFSLCEGDTLECRNVHNNVPIVDIDTITLSDGSTRRKYNNHACADGIGIIDIDNFVIEGIGGEAGLYFHSPLLVGGVLIYELVCYMEDGIELFGDCDYPDFVIVATDDVARKQNISISPNPANNFFAIRTKGPYTSNDVVITLFDMNGRVLLKKNAILENNGIIDTSLLEPGIYIISLTEKGTFLGSTTIVINHN